MTRRLTIHGHYHSEIGGARNSATITRMSRRPTDGRHRPRRGYRAGAARWLAGVFGIVLAIWGAGVPAGGQTPAPPAAADADGQDAAGSDDGLVGPPAPHIEEIVDGIWLATGFGANLVARLTRDGIVIAAAGEPTRAADAMAAALGGVSDQPVRYVVRMHRRAGALPALPAGWDNATLVAPEPYAPPPPGAGVAGPDLTFTRELSLFAGAAEVQLHHFAPAHTGADAVVLFPDRGVLFAGDLVVRGLPFIDYAAGGSSRGWVEALDGMLALDFETVVPGAGPPLTKADLQRFRDRFVTLRMRTLQLLYRNLPPDEALAALSTSGLDWPLAPDGPFARHSFGALYDELATEREEARNRRAAVSDEP